ncbi:MAG: anti-sigma factor family protein [Cyclonatronaceae bacterium]
MKLTSGILKKLIRAIRMTREDEIGCDDCFEQMNEFVELELAGKSPETVLPLVHDHLAKCPDCREEYEALVRSLQELQENPI